MEEGGWLPPEAEESKFLQTIGGYFNLKMKSGGTDLSGACAIEMKVSGELPRPAYVTIVFEMPKGESPSVVETEIKKGQSELMAMSDSSGAWEHYEAYRVEVLLYSDANKEDQIDYLEQFIRFERPPIFN